MSEPFNWEKIAQSQNPHREPHVFTGQGEPSDATTSIESEIRDIESAHIEDLLRLCVERRGSDLHLTVGLPPTIRLDGELVQLPYRELTPRDTQRLLYDIMSDQQISKFEQTRELDFSYGVKGLGRFRVNVYMQRDSVGAALRAIPNKVPSFAELRLPPILREVSKRTSGFILVTGPTGSGKSTTIATMIDDINSSRRCHIMTIEDPIEYLHYHKMAMVNQREVNSDTLSFHHALRAVLREDPDVILVGEMRDLETINAALTLAETGHLVFGTLHTRNAPQAIDRIVDAFPPSQQEQIRVLLANTLECVISQQLLPQMGGGRIVAVEIMIATPAIRNLIREGKTHQMYSIIETGSQFGMQTMDKALLELYRQGYVSYEEALMRALDQENFHRRARHAA